MSQQASKSAQSSFKETLLTNRQTTNSLIIITTITITVTAICGVVHAQQKSMGESGKNQVIQKEAPSQNILDHFGDYLFDENYILHFPSRRSFSFEKGVKGVNNSPQGKFSPDGKYLAYTYGRPDRGNDLIIYDIKKDKTKKIQGTHRVIKDLNWFKYRHKSYLLYNTLPTGKYDDVWFLILSASTFKELVSKMGWLFVSFLPAGEGISYDIGRPSNKVTGEYVAKFDELLLFDALMIPSKEAERLIASRAKEVILTLKNKDMEELSKFVHAAKGVRFSPYAYVDKEKDLVFSAKKLRTIFDDTTKYVWGAYDGTGFPIELTFREYYKRFIYNQDFSTAKEIGYNRIIGRGNTLNNNFETYSGSIIVEYHFPGFNPKYGGMDWQSLRLVFEKKDNGWYIVGIIHDQWTI